MSLSFRPAKRENVSLLIGLAGGTGSGKTYSAMRLAAGLAGGKPFAMIDTENRRALHYADQFRFDHADLRAPFRPDAYADAIEAAAAAGYGVILVDSFSHEHAGDGGLLDWHEEEFKRLGGRDAVKMTAWIKPKMSHKAMVSRLLQVNAHMILCFRAEEKLDIVKDADGKTKIVPKKTLTGLNGWVPISERNLPYELTLSFLLTADAPGLPKPIKLQEQHRPMVPLDRPITEETGVALAAWAAGGGAKDAAGEGVDTESAFLPTPAGDDAARTASGSSPAAVISDAQRKRLRAIQGEAGVTDDRLKELVAEIAGVESSRLIPRDRYEALCAAVQAEAAPTDESSYAARAAEAMANREAAEETL